MLLRFAAVALANDDFVICIVPSAEMLELEDPRIPKLKWQTFHCPRHPLVAPFNSTCATVSASGKYVAMGDEQGSVQLQEFPPKTIGGQMVRNRNFSSHFKLIQSKRARVIWV
jgi:hypothetical protein